MGCDKFSTSIAKGYRINNGIVGIENRESGVGQTTQTSLRVLIVVTPPIYNFDGINVNCSREFYLQPGIGIVGMRKGTWVVINGIAGRKFVPESGRLRGRSR